MSILPASGIGDESTGFYNDVIDQSVRFDDGDSPRLSKTFASGGSRTTFTYATWVKRSTITTDMLFLHSFGPTGFGIEGFLGFTSQDLLSFQFDYNSGNPRRLVTNRVFRDVANWYHICVVADSTNSTEGERLRMYINGIRETDFYDADYPSSSQVGTLNQAYSHYISGRTNNTSFFDGNLAEVNFLDGVAVTDTSGVLDEFIEIKNGVCIPKEVSGLSYGTTGFRFTFSDRSSASALGTDTSGNSNDFAVSGLADIDQSQDTPEINLATFNGLYRDYDSTPTYSAGNLRMDATTSSWFNAVSTISVSSGKWYAEFLTKSSTAMFVNIMESNKLPTYYPAYHTFAYAYYYNGQKWTNGSGSSYGDSYTNGDIIGVALDMDNGNVYFYKNGTVQNSGTAAFTGLSGDFVIGVSTSGTSGEWTANFGSDGSFNNRRGFGTNSDDNGIGQFVYAPPSGYLALCSANLSDPTIGPQASTQAGQHFNSKLWTGTGADADAKTGVGFQPDWLWAKDKNYANNHILIDSSRGVTKYLQSSQTSAEATDSNILQSFDSDGFTTIGQGINYASISDYVAWLWKANGGTTSSNTQGTVTSTVQANTIAGFSIIQYVGTGSALSYGHGLDERPTFYIVKDRDATNAWFIQYFDGSSDYYLAFSTASATSLSNFTPDATKMNYGGSSTLINTSSRNYIVYAFHSVPGYSKVGTYVGNSSTNGTYVYVGFRPAFVLIKNTTVGGNWCLFDNKNTPINPVNLMMLADTAGTQSAGGTGDNLDFLSNGFKLRDNSSGRNATGSTYLYLAFAEQPFKFSNSK